MRLRNVLLAGLLAGGLAVVPVGAASAIGGGNTLTVIAYFSDGSKQNLVGQKWWGCSGQDGNWGATTPYLTYYYPAC
ncbi:DUF6289 family protein [Actinocrispum wychmicini]|uniref:Uncharacterized protein n=1 Tax=Actinocrispum wychmicini TaxID=1213861 RepID=A0A4V2S5U8_9PSEU|nr:DUF6289 family protein [Actinocrispum wychmicini]TCO53490.1 hypothetical protein EV192_11079 [Actinocrispum wychmicini]